jgi:hypothetical protein
VTGPTRAMSVFDHYVADCAMAHMKAIRAAREGTPAEASALNVALFRRMHRLAEIAKELGPDAVFATPTRELERQHIRRLFPDPEQAARPDPE